MTGAEPTLDEVIRDGQWLAHRYDESQDAFHFRFVDRERHSAVAFLKDSELRDAPAAIFPRSLTDAAVRSLELPPLHLIFHSAYCCSTLLVRTFDVPGVSMGMSEPTLLTDVVELQLARRDPRLIGAVLDAALLLLARPLAPGETNVVKPSNVVNPLIRAILGMRPASRAVLLYAPLESLVASIAAKDIEGRDWARTLMWKLIRLGQVQRFGFSEEELYRQSDLQVAATGWLAQQASFAEVAESSQVVTLESEDFLCRPADALDRLQKHFGLDFDSASVANGPEFRRHSKERTKFDPEQRARDRQARVEVYRREIDMVMEWSRRLADFAGVPKLLPHPLLPDANRPAF